MDIKSKLTIKVLAALLITVGVSGFLLGTALTYQINQIQARDSYSYHNPVTIDIMKALPDNSLVANGWTYLGMVNGRYHYQFVTRNHIMNAGQNWQNSLLLGLGGSTKLTYIALGTTAYGTQADVSLPGGELLVATSLQRAAAQNTAIGAAGSGSTTMTLIITFTADAAVNGVDLAGLFAGTFTQANSPTLWAETTFAAVKLMNQKFMGTFLASGDTLTIPHCKNVGCELGLLTIEQMVGQNVRWSLS